MKLRKIIKHLDSFSNTKLFIETYDGKDELLVWTGTTLSLQVAADSQEEREQFLIECKNDEDYQSITEVVSAEKYLDLKLNTDINGEAISARTYENENGVLQIVFMISLKR